MDLIQIIEVALLIVGGAATVVKGLEVIASITPTTKDDKYVGYIKRGLGYLSYWLDVISMGLPSNKARKD